MALQWDDAGARLRENIRIVQANGRRANVPSLACTAALFFYASAAADHPPTHGGGEEAAGSERRGRALSAAEEMVALLEAHGRAHPGKKWNPGDKAAFKECEALRASAHPDAHAVVTLLADYLGTVPGSQFREAQMETLQGIISWYLEAGSPCAHDDEWRLLALVCTADLTMQRALAPTCSAQRREQLLAEALRQCEVCAQAAPNHVGARRGLFAQTAFVRAKVLLMQGALPEALEATQRATRLYKREKPRLGPFVALKLQLPLLKAKIQMEQEHEEGVA